jgi:hypothetical protein
MKIELIEDIDHDGTWYFVKKDGICVSKTFTRNKKEAEDYFEKIKQDALIKRVVNVLKSEEIDVPL